MRKLYIFDMGGVVVQNADVFPALPNILGFPWKQHWRIAGINLVH